jgi:hypothetical protein
MNYLSKSSIFIIGILFSISLRAQIHSIPPAYAGDVNRVFSQHPTNNYIPPMMNMSIFKGSNGILSNEYTLRLTMKDSSVKFIKSKIYADSTKHRSYIIALEKNHPTTDTNRELRIYCDATLDISRMDGRDIVMSYGVPTDSCWLFRVARGKINLYSHIPEIYDLTDGYIRAYQLGKQGIIMRLDTTKISPILKTDQKAYKIYLKGDVYKAVIKYNEDNVGL